MQTMTWKEAADVIEAADDPQAYEKAIDIALEALKTGVPRSRIDAIIHAVDSLHKIIVKDGDGEADIYCSMTEVFKIIEFYGDRDEEGGENGKT